LKFILHSTLVLVAFLAATLAQAQTLKGSPASIDRQYRAAISYGYAFVESARTVGQYIEPGQLVRVNPDRYMELHDVSYPYAVPATKLFLSRLSSQYYSACGEKMTVTSLLRPRDRQPANSVAKSVHPTGMAVDLRIPRSYKCRSWLENTLLSLERDRVLDVTREHHPPHYHVALFVKSYEKRLGIESAPTQLAYAATANDAAGSKYDAGDKYKVRRGDTLSEIARVTGVSLSSLRAANSLSGNRIYAGQKLRIPAEGSTDRPGGSRLAAVQGGTYKVHRGETLSEVALATGVSVSRLRAANGLRGTRIYAGQELDIPGSTQLAAGEKITHKVNRGDTLWRIANLYGTSVAQLRRVNANAGDDLQVGQVLLISKS